MIRSLSYIGFTSPNAEKWLEFGPEVLGLELAGRGPDGAVRLRVDDAAWRITVHPGERDDLAYLGWSVGGPDEFESAIATLEKHGFEVHARRRGAGRRCARSRRSRGSAIRSASATSSAGACVQKPASFRPGRPMTGFVTGDGGLGHAVLMVPDLKRAEQFYTEVLGFRLSDRIDAGLSHPLLALQRATPHARVRGDPRHGRACTT